MDQFFSRIGKAISFTLPLLSRLIRYVNDGRFCIDSNLVENAIRLLALGRKSFLFYGNLVCAVRATIVYSLVDTCISRGVDPGEWMEEVLLRIPGNENNREALRELLPDKWAKKSNKNRLDQLEPTWPSCLQLSNNQVVCKHLSKTYPFFNHSIVFFYSLFILFKFVFSSSK